LQIKKVLLNLKSSLLNQYFPTAFTIDRMKNCVQVWKSRKLSYKGKTIIVKNLLLSYCGFEIEVKGIPNKFKKEIETLIWDFIWEGKVNQIKRDVCC
jgi:hypothetical protein